MANTITLKRRIGSVKNTKQITKAMELVAASKMRRAQEHASAGRFFRHASYSLLTRLSKLTDVDSHPLFAERPVKTRLYVVVTSNRGLAGAYNSNILRMLTRAVKQDQTASIKSQVVTIGKQGANFARRIENLDLVAAYDGFDDQPVPRTVKAILESVAEMYQNKQVDNVQLLFTEFKSNLVQDATALSLLPAKFEATPDEEVDEASLTNTTFEPSITAVLDNVTLRMLEVQLWQALLESIASEHSMRMLAMKNATDNASDLIEDLTLAFNTARQAAITQELAEITGGVEAMQK
jgi:F-type H+-transporting ATPase subunit gamma